MPGAGIGWTKIISKNHANGEQKSLVDIGCWSILRIASPICFRVSGSLSTLQNDFILIAFIDFKPLLIKRLHGELHEKHMLKTFKMNRNSMLNGSKTVQYEPGPKPRTLVDPIPFFCETPMLFAWTKTTKLVLHCEFQIFSGSILILVDRTPYFLPQNPDLGSLYYQSSAQQVTAGNSNHDPVRTWIAALWAAKPWVHCDVSCALQMSRSQLVWKNF